MLLSCQLDKYCVYQSIYRLHVNLLKCKNTLIEESSRGLSKLRYSSGVTNHFDIFIWVKTVGGYTTIIGHVSLF